MTNIPLMLTSISGACSHMAVCTVCILITQKKKKRKLQITVMTIRLIRNSTNFWENGLHSNSLNYSKHMFLHMADCKKKS